jgi:hypothetical protein
MSNKTHFIATLAAIFTIAGSAAQAAGLKDADVAMTSGNWKVLRHIDSMKDTINCTGIYKENNGIQMTKDKLFVSVKGGIQSVTLRFGDQPARPLRLPGDMEKKIGSIIISGSDFSELVESNRLRVEAATLVRGIANEDLNLTGIKDALESIKGDCPIQADKTIVPKEEPACSDVLMARMKAQGLKETQILVICK